MFFLKDLDGILVNEQPFRLRQIIKAIYQDSISSFQEITTLPLELRKKLEQKISLSVPAKIFFSNRKKTIKAGLKTQDNFLIETVLMRHQDGRNTVCVSSQIGCPLNCSFCATGKMGFKRNLSFEEINFQVLFFNRILKKEQQRVNRVVFMGMGEPFLNFKEVLKALEILKNKDYFNLGARRLSVSTVGIPFEIKQLAVKMPEVNLALSLHAPDDSLRQKLMPIAKKFLLEEVFEAINYHFQKTSRKVMFEYLMLKGINDNLKQARELANLLKKRLKGPFMVNLIPYNPTDKKSNEQAHPKESGIFTPSSNEQIRKFKTILEEHYHIKTTQRYRFGKEIKGACGQLGSE